MYSNISLAKPIFHLKLKPSPPSETGLVTPGKAVDSSAIISTSGNSAKTAGIQLSEKGDSLKVFVPAVNIRYPLSRLAVIVEIEHGCYRIYAQPVHMILTQPKQRIRDKKALNLAPTDIKAACAPTLVLTSVLALIFV